MQPMPVPQDPRGFVVEWQIADEPAECIDLVADPELDVVLTEDEPAGTRPAWAGG